MHPAVARATDSGASVTQPRAEYAASQSVLVVRNGYSAITVLRSRNDQGHGSSVKNDKQYEGLRKKGMSKSRAAAISNSAGASSRGGKKSGGKKSS